MKKLGLIFILACFLIFGMMIGSPEPSTQSERIQEEIDDFEKEIEKPGNDFQPKSQNDVDPNLSNSLAKTGENIITDSLNFFLEAINSLVKK
jgi:hypothetical protein